MKKIITLIITTILLGNCASYKPDSSGVTQKDYNDRIVVDNPHYKVKPSTASYAGMVAFAGAGGYAAYKYGNIVTYYDKGERKQLKVADAAIGALTSFSLAYLANKLFINTNTIKGAPNYKKWMSDAKITDSYNYLGSVQGLNKFKLIDKNSERNFTVRNYRDVKDFETAFPNSNRTDNILKDAIKVVRRNELQQLINKYPRNTHIKDMKYHYIDTSPSLMEFYKTLNRYNDVSFLNKKGKIKSYLPSTSKTSLANVISKYPKDQYVAVLKTSYIEKSKDMMAFYNALNTYKNFKYSNKKQKVNSFLPKSSRAMLSSVISKYPNDEYATTLKTSYIKKSNDVTDLFEAKEKYPSINYNYDERALKLLTTLDELSLFEKKVRSSEIVIKGKNKIDNILWNKAERENSITAYKSYIDKAPLSLKSSLANEKIERLTREAEERRIERKRKNKESLDLYGYPLITNTTSYKTNGLDTGYTVWFDDGVVGDYRLGWITKKYNISRGFLRKPRYYHSEEDAIYGAYCKGKYKKFCSDDNGYYKETNTSSYNDYSSSGNNDGNNKSSNKKGRKNKCDKNVLESGNFSIPRYKTVDVGMDMGRRQVKVKFRDGTVRYIKKGKNTPKWYFSPFGEGPYYYNSMEATIYASYVSKKCSYRVKRNKY